MRTASTTPQYDRFALIRDRELSGLIDNLQWAFDKLNHGDAFNRGRLSDERVEILTVIDAAITDLHQLRDRQSCPR